jgi:radical SAM superfamily enzyme YgiQ (UPF0313 family)
MLRIQLVSAPAKKKDSWAELSEGMGPPLGLLYIAAYLRDHVPDVDIRVVDGLVHGYEKVLRDIQDFQPHILGISFNSLVAQSAYELVRDVRRRLPQAFIVGGGPHVTALSEDFLERSGADLAVIGEGEETFRDICQVFRDGASALLDRRAGIPGLAFREDNRTIRTPPRPYIKDLDAVPFPDRSLITLSDYRGWYLSRRTPEAVMIFSRGCPQRCTFCSNKVWAMSPGVRLRSPRNIVDEMEMLRDRFGVREIFDNSDEFNNDLEHAKAVCREMIRRKTALAWKTQLRAAPIDRELVQLMAESGCWYVQLGIESGNEETLRGIRKHITLEQVRQACVLLKEFRIKVLGFFMLFNVWEEKGVLKFEDVAATRKTLRFAKSLIRERKLDYFSWAITTPHPGSELYDIAVRHQLIKPELAGRWDEWIRKDVCVMRLPGVSDRDVTDMKARGAFLAGVCILRSGHMRWKDGRYLVKKASKIFYNYIKTFFGPVRALFGADHLFRKRGSA